MYELQMAIEYGASLEELCKLAGVDPEEVFGEVEE